MELSLKHWGKLRKAVVPINGITLVCGFNNSGKSTVIKSVYSFLSALLQIKKNIELNERLEASTSTTNNANSSTNTGANVIAGADANAKERGLDSVNSGDPNLDANVSSGESPLEISFVQRTILKTEMLQFFGTSIANTHNPQHRAKLSLKHNYQSRHDEELKVAIHVNEIEEVQNLHIIADRKADESDSAAIGTAPKIASVATLSSADAKLSATGRRKVRPEHLLCDDLPREILLFNNPELISAINHQTIYEHHEHTITHGLKPHERRILSLITNYAPQPLPKVYEELNAVLNELCLGELRAHEHEFVYAIHQNGKNYYMSLDTLSSTQKLALLCKSLLSRGIFNKRTMIVWDNLEQGLHPEDEIHLVKFLFLLQLKLKVKVVLSTSSIYVVRAFRALSREYEIFKMEEYLNEQGYDKLVDNVQKRKLFSDIQNALDAYKAPPKGPSLPNDHDESSHENETSSRALQESKCHLLRANIKYPIDYCLCKCNTRVSVNMSTVRVLKRRKKDLDVLNAHLTGVASRLM